MFRFTLMHRKLPKCIHLRNSLPFLFERFKPIPVPPPNNADNVKAPTFPMYRQIITQTRFILILSCQSFYQAKWQQISLT